MAELTLVHNAVRHRRDPRHGGGLLLGEQESHIPPVAAGGNRCLLDGALVDPGGNGGKAETRLLQQGFAGRTLRRKDQHEGLFSTLSSPAQAWGCDNDS